MQVAIVTLCCSLLIVVSALVYLCTRESKVSAAHEDRLLRLAMDALGHLKAQTLTEKVATDGTKAQNELAIQQLTQAYEDELNKIRAKAEPVPEAQMVTLTDGRRIPLAQLEPLSPDELLRM